RAATVAEDVAGALRAARPGGERGGEPRVLDARVVGDQVHDEDHARGVQPLDQAPERADVTEQGVDVPRVRHVVAVVDAGGAHDRGEPHPVDAQPLEVPGTVDHALQIAG